MKREMPTLGSSLGGSAPAVLKVFHRPSLCCFLAQVAPSDFHTRGMAIRQPWLPKTYLGL